MINEVLNKTNENRAKIEQLEATFNESFTKEFSEFKIGMAEDIIAIEKKINRNFEYYKKDTTKFRDRLVLKFKDFKKKIDDNHDLVLKRFAKERYAEAKISPKRMRITSDIEHDKEKAKLDLANNFSKERLEVSISSWNEEIEKMRDMMRRLSLLTSKEIEGLKGDIESFKKNTSADVKMAWKEVEAHERELTRQQEMYRSMLSEYYSVLEARKVVDYSNLKISSDIANTNNDLRPQAMNISHINIGKLSINKGMRPNATNSKSLTYGKTSKSDIKSEFPKIKVQPTKIANASSVNFSPSIRNQSEMRKTMKGILNTEEKQYEVLRRFVKDSSKKSVNRTINISPSEFRPSLISLQLAANITESKLNSSFSDNEKSGMLKIPEGPL